MASDAWLFSTCIEPVQKSEKANSGQPGGAKLPIPANAGTAGPPEQLEYNHFGLPAFLVSRLFWGESKDCLQLDTVLEIVAFKTIRVLLII
jgi:hypothetical protein